MKQFFRNYFLVTIITYFLIVSIATIFLFGLLQKIRSANEKNRVQLGVYQNLNIRDSRFVGNFGKITCDGDLLFQAGTAVTAIHTHKDNLYLSQVDNKLAVIDLHAPERTIKSDAPVLTDFYSNANDIYGADFFNDQVIRLISKDGKIIAEKVYPKIGHASALTGDLEGNYYASGYASGNITKIVGRDGFLFSTDLDKIVNLGVSNDSHMLVARYSGKPTLLTIDLDGNRKSIIEQEDSISSLVFDGNLFLVAYNHSGQTQIGKVINEKLVDGQVLNCPFPLKLAVWQDKLIYTSLADNEGKIYWINKNLQKNGK